MSTFDPNLEPPGDWQMPYDPPPPGPTGAGAAAAVYVWVCAGAGLVMSGCCVLSSATMMLLPAGEWKRHLPPDMPNREEFLRILPTLGVVMAVAGVILMLIPSLVLAILGFKVRSSGRGGTLTAMIVLGVQGVAMGLLLLVSLAGLAVTRTLQDLIAIVLMAGVLLLIGVTIAKLKAALNPRDSEARTTPWQ